MLITMSRQFGAGGSEVARRVADALGWSLVDNEFVEQVAQRAGLPAEEVADREERVLSFIERLSLTLASSAPELFPPETGTAENRDEVMVVRMTESLVAATGVGSLAGALILAAFGGRLPRHRMIFLGAGALGAILTLVGWIPWFGLAVVALALAGCALIFTYVNINTVLQTQAPDHLRGRVMGFYAFMALGLSPLGAFQIGWVSERFGVAWAISLGGVVTVAAVLWLGRSRLSPPPVTR